MTSETLSNDASYGLLAFDHFIAENFNLTQPQASDPHQYRELALRYLRLTPLERFLYHSRTFEESAEPPLPPGIRNASVRRGTTGSTEHPLWLRTCYAPDLASRYAELRSQCEVGGVYAVDAADCFDDSALYDADKDGEASVNDEIEAGDRDGVREGNAGLRALLLRAPMLADVVQYSCPEYEEFWGGAGRRAIGANEEYTLQWYPNGSGTRQRQACAGVCTADNRKKQMTLFGQSGRGIPPVSNCDEFPFAGSMEGGNGFIGLQSAANPLGVIRTCVAAYQNDLQGQCNSVLSSIRTNVNCFNEPNKPTEANALPKLWNDNCWTRKGSWGDNRQRLASYPANEPQPPSAGMSQADRNDPNNLGWFQKRNFTVQLAYTATSNPSASAFRPSSFTAGRIQDPSDSQAQQPSTHAVSANDASWIICAVNIQGQQRYSYSSFNGWCWDGQSTRDVWNRATYTTLFGTFVPPQQFRYFACKIDFQGSPGLAKRDQVSLGLLGNDPIYNTEPVQGPNTTFTVDVPLEQMPEAALRVRAEVQRERAAEFDAIQKLRLHNLKSLE
ncbi:putative chitinase [Seiridium unicorne]|uniref:Chitinase n=1 Tax=Seiridium unicorne TaxID=138068 RepID=A0ABR2ULI8_9PEZI